MSQHMVEMAVNRLLTDEALRVRFASDRIEVLALLGLLGVTLTSDEIDVFFQTDSRVWWWETGVIQTDRTHGLAADEE